MNRGLGRWTGRRKAAVALAACLGLAGCGSDAEPELQSDSGVVAGAGGSRDDASIEDGGDGSVDEGSGGSPGTGGSGALGGGTGGAGGLGGSGGRDDAGTDGGDAGGSGDGGEPDAMIDVDSGPQDAVCFAGGSEREATATGACDDPIVLDMRELGYGDAVFHRTLSSVTNGLPPSIGKCAEGTGRDIVFNVQVPDATDLEISVDAEDGSDPIILVQQGPDAECHKAEATACVDDAADGECEYLRVRVAAGEYESDTPQIVIAETTPSGASLVVRFRLVDPGSGS